jgi:hypothetical protein
MLPVGLLGVSCCPGLCSPCCRWDSWVCRVALDCVHRAAGGTPGCVVLPRLCSPCCRWDFWVLRVTLNCVHRAATGTLMCRVALDCVHRVASGTPECVAQECVHRVSSGTPVCRVALDCVHRVVSGTPECVVLPWTMSTVLPGDSWECHVALDLFTSQDRGSSESFLPVPGI